MANSGVYRIRNKLNDKCYVGSTTDIQARFYNHRWHLERGSHANLKLSGAWQKHGAEHFAFEILEEVADPSLLHQREQVWQDALRSFEAGYNMNPLVDSAKGRVYGKRVRRRIAEGARRAMADPDVKQRHSAATREAMKDPEIKRRTSEAARKRWQDPEYRAAIFSTMNDPTAKAKRAAKLSATNQNRYANLSVEEREAWSAKTSSTYEVHPPEGEPFTIKNLKRFCAEVGIGYSYACAVSAGKHKSAKGYVFKRVMG